MAKAFFIDTTLCTACRGCQIACKQWHDLPAENTLNQGSYQNPEDLSFTTYKLVRMREEEIDGRLQWLFFPDQCRHCLEPPCRDVADDPTAIFKDPATGAVVFTANTQSLVAEDIIESCPYNIPRKAKDSDKLAKCDMCLDRVQNGLEPACVKTCPTGAMNFGERKDMLQLAESRLASVKKKYPQAALLDPGDVSVIFLTAYTPEFYHDTAVAAVGNRGLTRKMALRKLFRPVTGFASGLKTG